MITLLTGASGFLGKHIAKEIILINELLTISRTGSDINLDLAIAMPDLPAVDLVIHCAGKAHSVPKTEGEKQGFFDVNLLGTANLLKGIAQSATLPVSFVFISTVAVYGCESGALITENYPLNAKDAYGQSKIQAEQLVLSWCKNNNVICSILRLPLLVGENPPGNLAAMIKGIKKGYYLNIAGGKAKKSMVLATDVARIIPVVANIGGVYNLTDGHHPSFAALSEAIAKQLSNTKPKNIPLWIARLLAVAGDFLGDKAPINSKKLDKITADLTFDDRKAREMLNWNPTSVIEGFKLNT